jgi:hypothetical protein
VWVTPRGRRSWWAKVWSVLLALALLDLVWFSFAQSYQRTLELLADEDVRGRQAPNRNPPDSRERICTQRRRLVALLSKDQVISFSNGFATFAGARLHAFRVEDSDVTAVVSD